MASFTSTDVRLLIHFTDHKILVVTIGGREQKIIEIPAAVAIHKEWGGVYFEEAIAARENNRTKSFVWKEHAFDRRNEFYYSRTDKILSRLLCRNDVKNLGLGTVTRYVVVCSSYKQTGENTSKFISHHISANGVNYICRSEETLYLKASGLLHGVTLNINDNITNLVYNGSYNGHVAGPGFDDIVNYFIKLLCMKGYDLTDTEGQAFCRELVLKYCYVALDLESEMKWLKENGEVLHEIIAPTGMTIELGKECFLAPECLFDPGLVGLNNGGVAACFHEVSESLTEEGEIPVLLCGYFMDGLAGFEERLQRDVAAISNKNIELKFQKASSLEQGASMFSKFDFPAGVPPYSRRRDYHNTIHHMFAFH
mmetsp:Transcript_14568/g.17005  ORF Transcript_14568/g.17005 Transcript_14568/m.17005 type:complete len:368 (-) Transcript_14568:2335-3438(-)